MNHVMPPLDGAPAPIAPRPTLGAGNHAAPTGTRLTDKVTNSVNGKLSRITTFEGVRGRSARVALWTKWTAYFLIVLLFSGVTEALTANVSYANNGGIFMLVSAAIVAIVGAGATVFYVNIRPEIIEKVRHYIFGLMLIPGTVMALLLRLLQEWEYINAGTLGSTLAAALPMFYLATIIIPMLVFIKEMLAMRTIYRSKLDDQEAVALWTRQDGLQR